jgi:hypothetical protein
MPISSIDSTNMHLCGSRISLVSLIYWRSVTIDEFLVEGGSASFLGLPRPIVILLPKPGLHIALNITYITYSIRKSKLNN